MVHRRSTDHKTTKQLRSHAGGLRGCITVEWVLFRFQMKFSSTQFESLSIAAKITFLQSIKHWPKIYQDKLFLFDLQESDEILLQQGAVELRQQEFLSSGSETVNLTAVAI